jgi:molybdenum cofactor cytidylyltransferase
MRTYGLIPAAGKSRRMGRPKLLLPLGDTTVLAKVVSCVRSAGVDDVVVVTAPAADDLARAAEAAGAQVARLAEDTPDMRASCLYGLAFIEQRFQPRDDDGWLLLPADHPTLRPGIVRAILEGAQRLPDQTIFVPTWRGRRGHPTWLRWSHVARLRTTPADQGLNRYIRAHGDETCELAWTSDEILRDLDTPEDYQQILIDGFTPTRRASEE